MVELIKRNEWKKYWIAALLFVIVFAVAEIVPSVQSVKENPYGGEVIAKSSAEEAAVAFVEEQTGSEVEASRVVHQSDKLLAGYLSKEKLLKDYEKQYDEQFPVDTFQVNLAFEDGSGDYGFVYVHMYTNEIVAWSYYIGAELLDPEEAQEMVADYWSEKQPQSGKWLFSGRNEDGDLTADLDGASIGEARLTLDTNAQIVNGAPVLTKFKPVFDVPDDYKRYVDKQDSIAGWLTGIGYGFMSFVLGVLAIIYAILYRGWTSFTYGIVLTVVFFVTYVIMNLGVMDGVIASQGELHFGGGILEISVVVTTIILSVAMAASVYFSIVGGDGLWKAQGRRLWPRLKDAGYGDYIWRSMGLSYLFAAILLGLQPLIFLALGKLIGTWGASDVAMSPYNMSALWLMPVLAWAAAISEEAVFRFFGIGLFRRWFRHTFAAAILPTLFWALGHVMYPFYPATTRLFELMVVGLIFSFIFVRYGFITAMFTHAIFNSVAVGSSLFLIGGTVNIVSAIVFILLPVPIAYILREWSKRKGTNPPTRSTIHPAEQQ
ncbi:CPBP family glutamic-type intramembrane protease [Paenibacillus soyae]|uniref:CPBP family glutamic-type intramembrane protease n=1 Tax=Paenibacillus soyae TaxID=2969249 RepID=A0A9X2SAR4_9BACL|nr:CPBP family glutamic-type intramembrane protease [Paenibacillus soyae]MCR2806240.1 CPBP family glutamic-type intramembrane protease [Paenibacillus soyae]